jgi:hypothetical protein
MRMIKPPVMVPTLDGEALVSKVYPREEELFAGTWRPADKTAPISAKWTASGWAKGGEEPMNLALDSPEFRKLVQVAIDCGTRPDRFPPQVREAFEKK